MPMIWNAEADAKLLALVLKMCDVKVPAATLKEIAGLMGKDCTPKALTHRIAKFRNATATTGGGVGASGKSASPGGIAKGGAGKGKGGAGKRGMEEVTQSVEGDGSGFGDEDGDDEEGKLEVKKVKVEAGLGEEECGFLG